MRHAFLAGVVPLALSTLAVAQPAPSAPGARSQLRPLPISELPERCRELATVPASALIAEPDLAAHVSVASCRAEDAMGQLALRRDMPSIAALDAAVQPSLQILDDVIEHGTARWQLIAGVAKADLYRGMVVRMRNVVPGGNAPGNFEATLTTWLDGASRASREAADIGRREPVGDDPVVRSALASLVASNDATPSPRASTADSSAIKNRPAEPSRR